MKPLTALFHTLKKNEAQKVLMGTRVPKDFFVTKGKGESDITVHAGSYHLALKDAGIERCNIMTYSSILPGIANKLDYRPEMVHGSVMETIMAVSTTEQGKRCTAAIIWGWLYNKKTGEKYGGLVCEYNGPLTEQEALDQLDSSLDELYYNGFSDDFDIKSVETVSNSFVPQKKYGTVLAALCFTSYEFPILEGSQS